MQTSSRFIIPLLTISGAQILVVLNDVIATFALPTIQSDLKISPATLPWVVNAHTPSCSVRFALHQNPAVRPGRQQHSGCALRSPT